MKKILPVLFLVSFLVVPVAAFGDCNNNSICNTGEDSTLCPGDCGAPTVVTSGIGLINKINVIGNWVFAGLLAVASLFLIYAGFMWITAGGDPQAATKARQMLTNALIGVVVALLARGLVQVIKSVIAG